MEEIELMECQDCYWRGDSSELYCSVEDAESDKDPKDIPFNRCPDCGSTNIDEIIERIDEDDES